MQTELIESGLMGDMPYAIVKDAKFGYFNGYVGVPPGHPWYGLSCEDIDAGVYRGLTYSHFSKFGHPSEIARIKSLMGVDRFCDDDLQWQLNWELDLAELPVDYPIETDMDIWWVGFDCAQVKYPASGWPESYRDRNFVFSEIKRLCNQAAAALNKTSADGTDSLTAY